MLVLAYYTLQVSPLWSRQAILYDYKAPITITGSGGNFIKVNLESDEEDALPGACIGKLP
jgi:hypothetical protein